MTDTIFQDWQHYADLLFLAAIAETEPEKARQHFDAGLKMWDGMGFKDRAAESSHHYATYKLALFLLAAARVKATPDSQSSIIKRLLALQSEEGGWITDYDSKGKPIGMANVETTCLSILGLEAVAKAD